MRGKPGHRTAPSLEWREKMPRSERRDRKTCLCWKAFTLTHLYKDIKKNPSALRAGGQGEGTGKAKGKAAPTALAAFQERCLSCWPLGGWAPLNQLAPLLEFESILTGKGFFLLTLTFCPKLFLYGSHFICSAFVTIVFVCGSLCLWIPCSLRTGLCLMSH